MITILCGKSASGKDTLLNELTGGKWDFERTVSTTSRPMREGEEEGKDYFYVSRDEFEKRLKNGNFVEHRAYDTLVDDIPDTWYYGVEKQELDPEKDYVVVLDLKGAENFYEAYKNKGFDILTCYIDVPDEVRTDRAKNRGSYNESEWNRRLADDNIKFSPENVEAVCDCVLHNNSDTRSLLEQLAGEMADFVYENNSRNYYCNPYCRFGSGKFSCGSAISDFVLEYAPAKIWNFETRVDGVEPLKSLGFYDLVGQLYLLKEELKVLKANTNDYLGDSVKGDAIYFNFDLTKPIEEIVSEIAKTYGKSDKFESAMLHCYQKCKEYVESLENKGYCVEGLYAVLYNFNDNMRVEKIECGNDKRGSFGLVHADMEEYQTFKTFDTFRKIDNALISNGILYAYNKNDLKERGFTNNQIADLQHKSEGNLFCKLNVDENTAIKFIGYACDLLDETTNTRTIDALAKQGIYNVPTELAQKISAERKFVPYEYSKSDEMKDIIGNALEYMGMLLSGIEQLQEEGVNWGLPVPINSTDLANAKQSYLKLGELQDTLRQPDFQKAMAEFTKSDVNMPKNDVKNKDNIRKD